MRRRRRGLGIKEIEGYGQRDERGRMLGDVSVEEGLKTVGRNWNKGCTNLKIRPRRLSTISV
jgi:hypothetical protein